MTRMLVLGVGNIGVALLKDYAACDAVAEVVAGDIAGDRLTRTVDRLGSPKIKKARIDATDYGALVKHMRGDFDVVVSTLPAHLNVTVIEAAIAAGVNYADVLSRSYHLHPAAKAAGVTVVPNIGLDPGIDRVLEGYAARQLDTVETIHMYCGGIPQKGTPAYHNPLQYKITWHWPSVIDSYFGFTDLRGGRPGKTRILRDGQIAEVDVLSGPNNPELIRFPEPLGVLEAFYSGAPFDTIEHLGLQDVTEAWEKTLRWPGHCDTWRKLINLHLLDRDPILVKGREIAPRDVFIEVGRKHLQYQRGEGDVVVERVAVTGKQKAQTVTYTYELTDFYDPATETTAMGRTTAVPCSIVSQLLARGAIREKGVVHPSKIGWDPALATVFFTELATRGIPIREPTATSLASGRFFTPMCHEEKNATSAKLKR